MITKRKAKVLREIIKTAKVDADILINTYNEVGSIYYLVLDLDELAYRIKRKHLEPYFLLTTKFVAKKLTGDEVDKLIVCLEDRSRKGNQW